jgi:arabinoxylan arabinofuranohydrolase
MKLMTIIPFFVCFVVILTGNNLADNPIVQTNYTADPAPMVHNGRVYLYTSHDDDVLESDFYTMRNYCCYSSTDMVNWTDHGIVATLANFKWANANNGAWAVQCVERNNKFYLYVPINGVGMGVYVSDSPTGPFTDPIGKKLINNDAWKDIDPTVFVDSSGQAHIYWGNGTLWYAKLNEDMTSLSGSIVTVNPKPTGFTEGPWFYKRDALYYLVYAGMDGGAENIQYATSNSPTGPWTSKGVLMSKQGTSYTNHPGVCDYKGNSYFFYHNAALTGGGSYHRSVCLEQFTYKTDGTIPSLTMSKDGPAQIDSLYPYDTVQAETICLEQGVETEVCSEGGINVGSIENGDYIKVKGVGFGSGATTFEARVASSTNGGKIELYLDSQTGTLVGTCDIAGTGGKQTWTTKSCTVTSAKGKHDLYLKFTGGSGSLFNFNWWRFIQSVNTKKNMAVQTPGVSILFDNRNTITVSHLTTQQIHGDLSAQLFTMQGKPVKALPVKQLTSGQFQFRLNSAITSSGAYMIKISSGNKILFQNSLIIQ